MSKREFPERPMAGVGGVVIDQGRVLLIRRGNEPARGEWSIPGGLIEVGETLVEAVAREIYEETGLTVRVVELIEALERIFRDGHDASGGRGRPNGPNEPGAANAEDAPGASDSLTEVRNSPIATRGKPRYHFVILDYLCERVSGEACVREEITDVAFVREEDLATYRLTPAAMRVVRKAFAMARARAGSHSGFSDSGSAR